MLCVVVLRPLRAWRMASTPSSSLETMRASSARSSFALDKPSLSRPSSRSISELDMVAPLAMLNPLFCWADQIAAGADGRVFDQFGLTFRRVGWQFVGQDLLLQARVRIGLLQRRAMDGRRGGRAAGEPA